MSMDQLQIEQLIDPREREKEVYEAIRPKLVRIINEHHVSENFLSFDKKKDYSSITYRGSVVARIAFKGTKATTYIEVPEKTANLYDWDNAEFKRKDGMVYFYVASAAQAISSFGEMISTSLAVTIEQYPKAFDCCSRYEECSNQKHCIHPDRVFASDCGYRRILKGGKVFYGKNRNV